MEKRFLNFDFFMSFEEHLMNMYTYTYRYIRRSVGGDTILLLAGAMPRKGQLMEQEEKGKKNYWNLPF